MDFQEKKDLKDKIEKEKSTKEKELKERSKNESKIITIDSKSGFEFDQFKQFFCSSSIVIREIILKGLKVNSVNKPNNLFRLNILPTLIEKFYRNEMVISYLSCTPRHNNKDLFDMAISASNSFGEYLNYDLGGVIKDNFLSIFDFKQFNIVYFEKKNVSVQANF